MLVALMEAVPTTDLGDAARRHRSALLTFAFRYLRDAHDAEEAVQAAFTRAVAAVADGVVPVNLRAWLYKIVLREALRIRERRRVRRTALPPASRDESGPGSDAAQAVMNEIDGLEEPARQVLLLRFCQHLSYEETAEALDLPVGTVKSHQSRALRLLKDRLGSRLDGWM